LIGVKSKNIPQGGEKMSKKKVKKAVLLGFDGPIFPEGVDSLNKIYNQVNTSGSILDKIVKFISKPGEFVERDRPATSDKYHWFWSLLFNVKEGKVAVLFPWSQDWSKRGGLQLDRSIALYTQGKVTDEDLKLLIGKLIAGFAKQQKKQKK